MATQADVKKAKTLVENAQKACEKVLGAMIALTFMPIVAALSQMEERVNAEKPYEGLTHEEAAALKEKQNNEAVLLAVEAANTQLAEIMEARKPKPKKVETEEPAESDEDTGTGEDDPDRLP
ncbi:hypothetical protein [Runella salmonicolor]|uniref:Uncharacterized protein n=1 Tax=Runella salmonicolor TaxID=2950278 RepID=A0ABT1FSI1_9BACT|nr:hypothetical protein [Runella salmonicolor]MCP1384455.1 hypothetical protein [Runella salmonicolor]